MSEYPEEFISAVNEVIDIWEGGYVNDPHDAGGETNMGISKRSYPDEDIKNLTRDRAVEIYYRDYWVAPGIDQIDPVLRAKVFNMGVLMGPQTAKNLAVGCTTLDEYRQVCEKHFQAIVIRHPVCARYLKGWERRALA
jgi:hypothetical protein